MINEARKTDFIDKRKRYRTGTTQQKRTDTEYTTNKTFLCIVFLRHRLKSEKLRNTQKKQFPHSRRK